MWIISGKGPNNVDESGNQVNNVWNTSYFNAKQAFIAGTKIDGLLPCGYGREPDDAFT